MSYVPDVMRKRIYDKDDNQQVDTEAIPDIPRSKITDFFSAPFWENIPDKKISAARIIAAGDTPTKLKKLADVVCSRNPTVITACEEPWTSENTNVTCTTSTDCVEGSYSAEIDVSVDYTGTGNIASYTPASSMDLSGKSGISLWMKIINGSTYPIDPGDLQLKLLDSAGNTLATYGIPAKVGLSKTMDWTKFEFVFDNPSNFTDVAKILLYKNEYLVRNFTMLVDLVQAEEWKDQNVIAQEMENLKTQGGGQLILLPGTYKIDAPIKNSTTGDFKVEIDGSSKLAVIKQIKEGDYFELSDAHYITLKNLVLRGGDRIYLKDPGADYFTITGCDVQGVVFGPGDYMQILYNKFVSTTTTQFYILSSNYVKIIGNHIDVHYFDLHEGCYDCIIAFNKFIVKSKCRIGWNDRIIVIGNDVSGKLYVGCRSDSVVTGNRCETLEVTQAWGDGTNVKIVGNQFGSYILTDVKEKTEIDFGEGYNFFKYNMAVYAEGGGDKMGTVSPGTSILAAHMNQKIDSIMRRVSASPTVGTGGTLGGAVDLAPPSGFGRLHPLSVKIEVGGTVASGETITVRVTAVYSDETSSYVDKSYTATGTYYLDIGDLHELYKDGVYITKMQAQAASSEASTSATVTVEVAALLGG